LKYRSRGSSSPTVVASVASQRRARFGFCSLSDAIRKDSVQGIRMALEEDPLAACRPLPDNQEAPVVAAVRCCCSPEVLAALLQGGADPDAMGADRMPALELVSRVHHMPLATWAGSEEAATMWMSMPGARVNFPSDRMSEERCCAYARWLLAFGANKSRLDAEGASSADHAQRSGRTQLADLIRHWGGEEARALRALTRSRGACSSIRSCRQQHLHGATTAHRKCLLCLPEAVHDIVRDILAPMPALS